MKTIRDEKMDELKELVKLLNKYRNAYYNENKMLVSDKEYDDLFDRVTELEKELNVTFPNSPTSTVGYIVQSKLKKVTHTHPMLSLNKTKELEDIVKFADGHDLITMFKEDGLTVSLHYDEKGNLVSAETRGDGKVGEDIFNNALVVENIPKKINNGGIPLTIDGEIIVTKKDFNTINNNLSEGIKFSHPRNYAAGSIRQLDTKITAERKLKFIAWRVIEGLDAFNNHNFCDILEQAIELGFDVVPYQYIPSIKLNDKSYMQCIVEFSKEKATRMGHPIDGLVFSYNDMEYGDSLGMTGHHPRHSMAFKFYDEVYKTTLRGIEWQVGRTGQVTPVAVFDEVDLDGAVTSKASLHNLSYIKELELGINDTITVYRANAVIPQVQESITKSGKFFIPTVCPCCGDTLELRKNEVKENGVRRTIEYLFCNNPNCSAKQLAKFKHFVSKPCMNIDGLSEKTLEVLLETGLVKRYIDIYFLATHVKELLQLDGWGAKKVNNLLKAIEKSRKVPLANFIFALGIPLIGKEAAKTIAKHYKTYANFYRAIDEEDDFTQLEDFGKAMDESIKVWGASWIHAYDEKSLDYNLEIALDILPDESEKDMVQNDFINGKIFVVTGAFNTMKRSEIEKIIIDRGGKLSGSVSKKTNYLLTNDEDSGSSKSIKAKELNIPIMSEAEFLSKIEDK